MPDSSAKPPNQSGFFSGTFMLIWLLGWTAITLVFDTLWIVTTIWQAETSGYVSTAGTIVESKVETGSGSEGETTYSAKVSYEYQVGGQKLLGNRISYATRFTSGRKAARNTVRRYPRGKQITVYYSSAQPAAAVLEPGIRGSDFFAPLFLTPFNLIAFGGWYARLVSGRKGARPAGLRIKDDGVKIVARLYNVRPITSAAAVLLIASFVLIFVCGFEIIPAPTDWVVVSAWCTALAAAAGAYAVFRQPRTRLAYDEFTGRITIVQSDGQEHAFTSSDVARVGVEEVGRSEMGVPEQHDEDGKRLRSFSPTITYRDADVERTVPLASWTSQEAAEWTVQWLRTTLRLDV